jgi:hypothetical protein
MAQNPNTFNSILVQRPKYNTFDMSHDVRYTFDMGRLVPITRAIEYLPGDRWNISVQSMLRMAPMIAPVMHQIFVKHYFFAVPTRLLWEGFNEFLADPGASQAVPYFALSASIDEGDIGDYLGYPIDYTGDQVLVDAGPAAGYALIWDEWFRDQNLQTETFTPLVTGNVGWARTLLESIPYPVSWRHDYFTSALTSAQRGTAVQLPLLASDAAITLDSSTTGTAGRVKDASDHTVFTTSNQTEHSNTGVYQSAEGGGTDAVYDPNGTLILDASSATFNTIEAIRYAFRLQEYLEISMLAGTRYHEYVYAFFGVRTPDYRIGRPELIGMTTGNMVISEVLQTAPAATSAVSANTPLGTMGGHGLSMTGGNGFNYYASEHGYIYGFITVVPRAVYSQGLHRGYTRMLSGQEAYYNYKFAHLGEQAILNKELYLSGTTAADDGTFGYTPRYSEYREERSRIAGEMRSSMDHWHLARSWSAAPSLNEDFITVPSGDDADEDNLKRIFAVDYGAGAEFSNHSIIGHTFVKAYARRLIPKYGQPML